MPRQAPKLPDDDPHIVDLARYKRARQAQAKAKSKPTQPRGEPILGSRRGAGLILWLMVLAMAALGVLTNLH